MRRTDAQRRHAVTKGILLLTTALATAGGLTGCIAVGYSSRGGWFLWPGSLGFLLILALLFFFLRGRR